ncbi:hypothetical protein C4D60_Mb09t22000 [Musa balbisiana]|uniref:PITH domain-containing protein n=1 Tax=Musa balbisiana TaxID=52838 RepID=A0A4S8II54_MUSBA|nr:hypothetical protein C4D60_Mb09t22000 [Musa balbisiana]
MTSTPSSSIPRGQVDLVEFVDWSGVECLNQTTSHPIVNALKQLKYHMPKLYFVMSGPKTVKLFANKEHMGFSNVNDYPPSDSIDLSLDNLKGMPVTVKYVKFQNIHSLTIFIEDNQGGSDVTKVQKIAFLGTTVDTTNMKDLKKIEEH